MKRCTFFVLALSFVLVTLAYAQDTEFWTTMKGGKQDSFHKGPSSVYSELGKVKIGTKVIPLEYSSDYYHVEFPDGQIGWVHYDMLIETQRRKLTHDTDLHNIASTSGYKGGKVIQSLAAGDIVTSYGLGKNGSWYNVVAENGKKGCVIRQYAVSVVQDELPQYDSSRKIYIHKDKFIAKVVGLNSEQLRNKVGIPGGVTKRKNKPEKWYYSNRVLVNDGRRCKNFYLTMENGTVTSVVFEDEGRSNWVEALPGASIIRSMGFLDFGHKLPQISLFGFTKNWPWYFKIFVWIVKLGIALLFLSLGSYLGMLLSGLFQSLPSLGNNLVKFLSFLSIWFFSYLYFLCLGLHMFRESEWIIAVIMFGLSTFYIKTIFSTINYERCPNCHTMFKVEDRGAEVIGKTHVTTHKSKDVYSHTTENSTHRTKHYKRKEWDEHSTDLEIEDSRECAVCGYEWTVDRYETEKGHT